MTGFEGKVAIPKPNRRQTTLGEHERFRECRASRGRRRVGSESGGRDNKQYEAYDCDRSVNIFSRAISTFLLAISLFQSKLRSPTVQPKPAESSKSSANSEA
jgi:hypothetical protein